MNLPVVMVGLLAGGLLVAKGGKAFQAAFSGAGTPGSAGGEQPENLGQGSASTQPGAGPMPGVTGVRAVWLGARELATAAPGYVWGGGHGSDALNGADCSGAISYVLNRAGLLKGSLTSGQFMGYGDAGPGKYVTIWANDGHVIMSIDTGGALHWFGTSGFGHPNAPNRTGANWFTVTPSESYLSNFTPRHPPGL